MELKLILQYLKFLQNEMNEEINLVIGLGYYIYIYKTQNKICLTKLCTPKNTFCRSCSCLELILVLFHPSPAANIGLNCNP